MKREKTDGLVLHAKHAYMPNFLGHCGPDDRGRILELLHGTSSRDEKVEDLLKDFEAAYPFVRFIGEATSRDPFDYKVTEAYWIGNSLLDSASPEDFYRFASNGLSGMCKNKQAKLLFSKIGPFAKPHHTFYVLSLFSRKEFTQIDLDDGSNDYRKIQSLMDNCRISWGKVTDVRKDTLDVRYRPIEIRNGSIGLSKPVQKQIKYDREIPSFNNIRSDDYVSIHWNFASEKLTNRQVQNLRSYTVLDAKATNRFLELLRK